MKYFLYAHDVQPPLQHHLDAKAFRIYDHDGPTERHFKQIISSKFTFHAFRKAILGGVQK